MRFEGETYNSTRRHLGGGRGLLLVHSDEGSIDGAISRVVLFVAVNAEVADEEREAFKADCGPL